MHIGMAATKSFSEKCPIHTDGRRCSKANSMILKYQTKRILWHLFGAVTTIIFAEGVGYIISGKSTTFMDIILGPVLAGIGFVGLLFYAQWYRSG
jgi:hypothetical protein